MNNEPSPPEFPAGPMELDLTYGEAARSEMITELEHGPALVRDAIRDLEPEQLDTRYRNWTIRQIVHHLADSHVNAYVRSKWTLTEASPLIKSYNETRWSEIEDARTLPVESSLAILDGIHTRWAAVLRNLSEIEFEKDFFHPQLTRVVSLRELLPSYVWHTRHHTAQIHWVRERQGW